MKASVAIFFVLLLSHLVAAQSSDSATFKTGSYVSLMVRGAQSLSDLNEQLRAAGHAPLTEALIGFSVGVTNRFAAQNSYSAGRFSGSFAADDLTDDGRRTTLTVWELATVGHYDVVASLKWLVYPYLGIGSNYARLSVSTIEPGGSFQNSLTNLGSPEVVQKKYGSDGLMIFGELGGGIERLLSFPGSDVYVGLSGGYRLSTDRSWVLAGVKSFDSSFSTQGWTFELKFRFEAAPERSPEARRGLFKFFK